MMVADDQSKPLPRQCGTSLSVLIRTAESGQHTDIKLQGILHRDFTLRLYVENEELELQSQDNQTWTPAQLTYVACFPTTHTHWWPYICRGVSPTSEMRIEIQMRRGHLFWAKDRLAGEVIDLQELFNEYWGSVKHVFTVPSQSWSPTVRLYLMAKRRGHYFRWKASRASLVSRIAILCEHHRSFLLCNRTSPRTDNLRIDGIPALFAP